MVTCSQKACFRLFERGVGAAGPLFVALAIVLIFGSAFVYFYILLPFIYPDGSYVHTLIPAWLVVLIGFNYAAAVITPPGSNTHLKMEEARRDTRSSEDDGSHLSLTRQSSSDSEDLHRSSDHFVDISLRQVSFPPCKKCHLPKPPRAHHCSVCKRCVLRMDHHCPWMSNCIGNFNHRYFYLFLFYLTVGCHYLCGISFRLFFATITDIMAKKVPAHARLIIGVWMLAFLMGIAIGVLCGYHTYLILSNLTTIEHYAYKDQAAVSAFDGEAHFNEYDIGRWDNLRAFFGTRHKPLYYVLLPLRVPPNSNGLHYPTLRLNPLHLT